MSDDIEEKVRITHATVKGYLQTVKLSNRTKRGILKEIERSLKEETSP
jgi:hypothetical protein